MSKEMTVEEFSRNVWSRAIRTTEFRTEEQEKYEFAEAYAAHKAQAPTLTDDEIKDKAFDFVSNLTDPFFESIESMVVKAMKLARDHQPQRVELSDEAVISEAFAAGKMEGIGVFRKVSPFEYPIFKSDGDKYTASYLEKTKDHQPKQNGKLTMYDESEKTIATNSTDQPKQTVDLEECCNCGLVRSKDGCLICGNT